MAELEKLLIPLVIGLVVLSVILSLGATITHDVGSTGESNITANIVNDSITALSTGTTLRGNLLDEASVRVINATNITTGEYHVVTSGNYTTTYNPATITFNSGSAYVNDTVNITYTYVNNTRSAVYGTANNGTQALGDISTFLPLLAIVAIASIIVMFLIGAFRA